MCLKKTKPNQKNFLSFRRLAYYLPFLVMNVPSSSAVVPFSLSAEEWLWFPLPLITIKETSLIFFFSFFLTGDLKVMKTIHAANVNSQHIYHPPPPPPFLPAVLLYHWADWRGRNDTSPSSAHLSPNKESRLNAEQLPLFEIHITWERRQQSSFCLCPQLDSTPRACKLIKKLGGTISLTRWRAIVSWWCAWYSMRLHYDYNNPVFFFNTHTHTH